MGQYYLICNLDKKEYLHPHRFGAGLKAREWGFGVIPQALSILLIDGDGRGGGDYNLPALCGRWAGDRIVISGDYGDKGKFTDRIIPSIEYLKKITEDKEKPNSVEDVNIWDFALEDFHDISKIVIDEYNAVYGDDPDDGVWTYKPRFVLDKV